MHADQIMKESRADERQVQEESIHINLARKFVGTRESCKSANTYTQFHYMMTSESVTCPHKRPTLLYLPRAELNTYGSLFGSEFLYGKRRPAVLYINIKGGGRLLTI